MSVAAALVLLAGVAGPPAPPVAAPSVDRVPMIGLEGPAMDACGGIGRIGNYDAEEPVRENPADGARTTDKLPHQSLVWLCEAAGEWQGIVYPSGRFQDLGDCQVGSPVADRRPYDGPCKHGWVLAEHLSLVSG